MWRRPRIHLLSQKHAGRDKLYPFINADIIITIMVSISNFTKYNIVTESDNSQTLKDKSNVNFWVGVNFISTLDNPQVALRKMILQLFFIAYSFSKLYLFKE